MKSKNVESVSCTLCGNDEYEILFKPKDRISESAIVKCKICGLVYVNPRIKFEELKNDVYTYENYFSNYFRGRDGKLSYTDGLEGKLQSAREYILRKPSETQLSENRRKCMQNNPSGSGFLDVRRQQLKKALDSLDLQLGRLLPKGGISITCIALKR